MRVLPFTSLCLFFARTDCRYAQLAERAQLVAYGPNGTCPVAGTTTYEVRPVYYSDFIPKNTIIDPFRDGHSFTVTNAPTVVVILSYITTIITPAPTQTAAGPYTTTLQIGDIGVTQPNAGSGTSAETTLVYSGSYLSPSTLDQTASYIFSSTSHPILEISSIQSTTASFSPTSAGNTVLSQSVTNNFVSFPPTSSTTTTGLSNQASQISPRSITFTKSRYLSTSQSSSVITSQTFPSASATASTTAANTTPSLSIGEGIPSGSITSLPFSSPILLAVDNINVERPPRLANFKRQNSVPNEAPTVTSASAISIVNLATADTSGPSATAIPTGEHALSQDDCDDATPFVLSDGLLLHGGTAVGKYRGATSALLGILGNDAPLDQVNRTFSFLNGYLHWETEDVGPAKFYSCDGILWAGFPSPPAAQCIQVLVGAIAVEACEARVQQTGSVNPSLTEMLIMDSSTYSIGQTMSSTSIGHATSAPFQSSSLSAFPITSPALDTISSRPLSVASASSSDSDASSLVVSSNLQSSTESELFSGSQTPLTPSTSGPSSPSTFPYASHTELESNSRSNSIAYTDVASVGFTSVGSSSSMDPLSTSDLGAVSTIASDSTGLYDTSNQGLASTTSPSLHTSLSASDIDPTIFSPSSSLPSYSSLSGESSTADSSMAEPASSNIQPSTSTTPPPGVSSIDPLCNEDDCLRNLRDPRYSSMASTFCPSYTQSTAVPTPVWMDGCGGLPSRVSSACSCFLSTTASSEPSSASDFSISTASFPSPSQTTVSAGISATGSNDLSGASTLQSALSIITSSISSELLPQVTLSTSTPSTFGAPSLVSVGDSSYSSENAGTTNAAGSTISSPVTYTSSTRLPTTSVAIGPLCSGQTVGQAGVDSIGTYNYEIFDTGLSSYEIACYALQDSSTTTGTLVSNVPNFENAIFLCDLENTNNGLGACQGVAYDESAKSCLIISRFSTTIYPDFGINARTARLIFSGYPFIADAFYLQPDSHTNDLGLCVNRAYSYDAISPEYSNTYDNLYENECGRHFNGIPSSRIDSDRVLDWANAIFGSDPSSLEDCLRVCDYGNHLYLTQGGDQFRCLVYTFDTSSSSCTLYGATDGTISTSPTINGGRLINAVVGYPSPTDRPTVTGYVSKFQYVSMTVGSSTAYLTSSMTSSVALPPYIQSAAFSSHVSSFTTTPPPNTPILGSQSLVLSSSLNTPSITGSASISSHVVTFPSTPSASPSAPQGTSNSAVTQYMTPGSSIAAPSSSARTTAIAQISSGSISSASGSVSVSPFAAISSLHITSSMFSGVSMSSQRTSSASLGISMVFSGASTASPGVSLSSERTSVVSLGISMMSFRTSTVSSRAPLPSLDMSTASAEVSTTSLGESTASLEDSMAILGTFMTSQRLSSAYTGASVASPRASTMIPETSVVSSVTVLAFPETSQIASSHVSMSVLTSIQLSDSANDSQYVTNGPAAGTRESTQSASRPSYLVLSSLTSQSVVTANNAPTSVTTTTVPSSSGTNVAGATFASLSTSIFNSGSAFVSTPIVYSSQSASLNVVGSISTPPTMSEETLSISSTSSWLTSPGQGSMTTLLALQTGTSSPSTTPTMSTIQTVSPDPPSSSITASSNSFSPQYSITTTTDFSPQSSTMLSIYPTWTVWSSVGTPSPESSITITTTIQPPIEPSNSESNTMITTQSPVTRSSSESGSVSPTSTVRPSIEASSSQFYPTTPLTTTTLPVCGTGIVGNSGSDNSVFTIDLGGGVISTVCIIQGAGSTISSATSSLEQTIATTTDGSISQNSVSISASASELPISAITTTSGPFEVRSSTINWSTGAEATSTSDSSSNSNGGQSTTSKFDQSTSSSTIGSSLDTTGASFSSSGTGGQTTTSDYGQSISSSTDSSAAMTTITEYRSTSNDNTRQTTTTSSSQSGSLSADSSVSSATTPDSDSTSNVNTGQTTTSTLSDSVSTTTDSSASATTTTSSLPDCGIGLAGNYGPNNSYYAIYTGTGFLVVCVVVGSGDPTSSSRSDSSNSDVATQQTITTFSGHTLGTDTSVSSTTTTVSLPECALGIVGNYGTGNSYYAVNLGVGWLVICVVVSSHSSTSGSESNLAVTTTMADSSQSYTSNSISVTAVATATTNNAPGATITSDASLPTTTTASQSTSTIPDCPSSITVGNAGVGLGVYTSFDLAQGTLATICLVVTTNPTTTAYATTVALSPSVTSTTTTTSAPLTTAAIPDCPSSITSGNAGIGLNLYTSLDVLHGTLATVCLVITVNPTTTTTAAVVATTATTISSTGTFYLYTTTTATSAGQTAETTTATTATYITVSTSSTGTSSGTSSISSTAISNTGITTTTSTTSRSTTTTTAPATTTTAAAARCGVAVTLCTGQTLQSLGFSTRSCTLAAVLCTTAQLITDVTNLCLTIGSSGCTSYGRVGIGANPANVVGLAGTMSVTQVEAAVAGYPGCVPSSQTLTLSDRACLLAGVIKRRGGAKRVVVGEGKSAGLI